MREVTGSSPVSSTKTKGNCESSCLLFWVPAARGGLHPSALKCSGRRSRPSAEILPGAKHSYSAKAPPARRPGGWFAYTFSRFHNIDFNRPSHRPCLKNVNMPKRRFFSRYAALIFPAIHQGLPHQIALSGEKIPCRWTQFQFSNRA